MSDSLISLMVAAALGTVAYTKVGGRMGFGNSGGLLVTIVIVFIITFIICFTLLKYILKI
jgi:hypothetical protein